MSETRRCLRCGKTCRVTPSGHLRAHRCPHDGWCVAPYADRRHGGVPMCPACFTEAADAPEQLTLSLRSR